MSEPLATYLHDHLAGSQIAVDLLAVLRDEHANEPLARFAADLLAEVEADRAVLRRLTEQVGPPSNPVKEAAAWLAEKVTRVKLHRQVMGGLGTFEAVEALGLGIQGKLALWRALGVAAGVDARLAGVDFAQLAERAQAQHARTEQVRLDLAVRALAADADDRSASARA
jgi:hypothetical protein